MITLRSLLVIACLPLFLLAIYCAISVIGSYLITRHNDYYLWYRWHVIQEARRHLLVGVFGFLTVLLGLAFILLPWEIASLFGGFFIVTGYQIVLWAVGIETEFFGNVQRKQDTDNSSPDLPQLGKG